MIDGTGFEENTPTGITPENNEPANIAQHRVQKSGPSRLLSSRPKEMPATVTRIHADRQEEEKRTVYETEGSDIQEQQSLRQRLSVFKNKTLPATKAYLKDYYLDVMDARMQPSFSALKDLVIEYPDGVVYVHTSSKDQPLRHKFTLTNSITIHETTDRKKTIGDPYAETLTINPDAGEFVKNTTLRDASGPEIGSQNRVTAADDFTITAMDRIDKLLEINPNQHVIYIGVNNRIYDLKISRQKAEYEELRQKMINRGAFVFEPPVA